MLKKVTSYLLLVGCIVFFSSAAAQDLEFYHFGPATQLENVLLQKWVDEWNAENPDAQVTLTLFPTADYVAGPVLTTAFASGVGPDVFVISPGKFLQYVEGGIAADLSELFTPEVREDLQPAALEAITVDGVQYAVPFEQEPVALFYNKDIFEETGLEVPSTFEELLTVSEQLKEAGYIPIVVEPSPGPYQNFTWYPFLWSTGADAATSDLSEATFDSEGVAEALDLWRALVQNDYTPRTTSNTTADISSTPFVTGEAAMWFGGVWAIRGLPEFPDLNVGIAPPPALEGQEPVSVYGGWTMMANSRSQNLETAKRFIDWMWLESPDRALEWATEAGVFSPRISVTEAGADFFDQPLYSDFRDEIIPIARAEPAYPADMVQIISDAIQTAMFRNTPGEEAAGEAQRRLEDFLRQYNSN